MSQIRSTIIEQNFPAIRRKKSNPTLDGIIKSSLASAFLTFVEAERGTNRAERGTNRPTLAESQQAISTHFRRIHSIIDSVDEHIRRRLENHQNEVFSLVKGEIEQMRAETEKIVEQLNQAIAHKNTEDQIWKLSNELDYFQSQTYSLFSDNKKLREEINHLKTSLRELHVQIENNDLVMQKLRKKLVRENFIKEKLVTLIKDRVRTGKGEERTGKGEERTGKGEEISMQQVDEILRLQKVPTNQRIKTEPTKQTSSNFFQSKVNIQLNNNSVHNNPTRFTFNQQQERITEKFSIPSSFNQDIGVPDLPPVQFVRVESILTDGAEMDKPKSSVKRRRVQTAVQTEGVLTQQPTQRQGNTKLFSNTSYIQMPHSRPPKKVDLYKSGFFVRSYNQKTQGPLPKNQKSAPATSKTPGRYPRNELNKSKMGLSKVQVGGGANKSCLK